MCLDVFQHVCVAVSDRQHAPTNLHTPHYLHKDLHIQLLQHMVLARFRNQLMMEHLPPPQGDQQKRNLCIQTQLFQDMCRTLVFANQELF